MLQCGRYYPKMKHSPSMGMFNLQKKNPEWTCRNNRERELGSVRLVNKKGFML